MQRAPGQYDHLARVPRTGPRQSHGRRSFAPRYRRRATPRRSRGMEPTVRSARIEPAIGSEAAPSSLLSRRFPTAGWSVPARNPVAGNGIFWPSLVSSGGGLSLERLQCAAQRVPSPLRDMTETAGVADERDIEKIRLGQSVLVRPAAFRGREIAGTVSFIAPLVEAGRNNALGQRNMTDVDVVEVLVNLGEPGSLAVGMKVDVYFRQSIASRY